MYPVTRAKGPESSLPEIAAGLSYALKWGSNSLIRYKRDLYFAKETYIFRDSTNRSHPMSVVDDNDHYYSHTTTNTSTIGQRRSLNTATTQ